jgi:hypothetical protein
VPEVRRLPVVPDPDPADPDPAGLDPADPDPAGLDPDPAEPEGTAAAAAARPQTLQYPSSIVPPQFVQVLIATALPLSAPPSGLSSRQLAYWSFGGDCGGPSQLW